MHRVWIVAWVVVAMLAPVWSRPARAQSGELCFQETGLCIDARFAAYWQQNGGLQVFGYPTSRPFYALNADTGRFHLMQWFERNRLEWHPDNAPPYDVLLGRLGDELLRARNIDWRTAPRASGPQANCLWFPETGHNVCDQAAGVGFKSYWERHGLRDPRLNAFGRSLALFGLPLTEARMETNSSGDTVLTQWFERARFEWHPDQPDDFKVLLGLLGNEYPRAPEGPPPNDPCANIPPPRAMFIEPNCVRADGVMIIGLSNLQPNQEVTYVVQRGDGSVVVGPAIARADGEGRYRRFVRPSEWGLAAGDYAFIAQTGQDHGGPSRAFFRVLP